MNELTIKIKISYERQEELQRIIEKLGKDVRTVKAPRQQLGKFRKVYIELKESIEKNE